MLGFKARSPVLSSPRLGILNLGGDRNAGYVEADSSFLRSLFGGVRSLDLTDLACDVLFLYAELRSDGSIANADRGLREIIRDSGAKVVVVASPNPGDHYIKGGRRKPYGHANLVMTIDRRGQAFERFFSALFIRMNQGVSMPVAWVQLNPQVPESEQLDNPGTIFACELGQLAFGR
jgi:hypothetical protein